MMKVKGKAADYIKGSEKVSVRNWTLGDIDALDDGLAPKIEELLEQHRSGVRETYEKTVLEAVSLILEIALKEYPPQVDIEIPGGTAMINIGLPFAEDDLEVPRWMVPLRDAICIDLYDLPSKKLIRQALMAEIEVIDAAIAKEQT